MPLRDQSLTVSPRFSVIRRKPSLVADRKHQRAKVLARSARFSVTDYHNLLLMHRLELEPFSRALARVVESQRAWRSGPPRALAAPWRTRAYQTRRRAG